MYNLLFVWLQTFLH